MITTIFIIITFQQSPATIRMIIIIIIFLLIIIMIFQQSPASTMVSFVLSLLLPFMALAAPGSQVEKAPSLSIKKVIWILASDTVFVKLNQYSQILRQQCCLESGGLCNNDRCDGDKVVKNNYKCGDKKVV